MLKPPGTPLQPMSSRASIARPPLRWLALARGAWVVCALLLLANFIVSIPAYYRLLLTICTLPNQGSCTLPGQVGNASGQLTPDNAQALAHLHLSVATYATYVLVLIVVVSLLFWGVGLLIFRRKSDEGMGLFVSLLLVLYGATGVNDYFLGAWAPMQPPLLLQILLFLIQAAQWTGLVAFLLTFPTGRFVPRWSWLLILFIILLNIVTLNFFPGWASVLNSPAFNAAGVVLVFGSTLFIMVYRYVRVFDAVQRQQTKWVVYTAAVGILLAISGTVLSAVTPADSPNQLLSATTDYHAALLSTHSPWPGDRDSALPLMGHRCHHQSHPGLWLLDRSASSALRWPHLCPASPVPGGVQPE